MLPRMLLQKLGKGGLVLKSKLRERFAQFADGWWMGLIVSSRRQLLREMRRHDAQKMHRKSATQTSRRMNAESVYWELLWVTDFVEDQVLQTSEVHAVLLSRISAVPETVQPWCKPEGARNAPIQSWRRRMVEHGSLSAAGGLANRCSSSTSWQRPRSEMSQRSSGTW